MRLKNYIVSIFFLSTTYLSFCQKQGNVWYFGFGAGLSFNYGTVSIFSGGNTGAFLSPGILQEGSSSICDSSGSPLFYTGGNSVWNRYNNLMPNGTGIMGGPSATQGALILPKPGSDSLFYIFTTDEFQNYDPPSVHKGYRYSVVNMCLDGGGGDVVATEKNILLMENSTEKLAACLDHDSTGYWVLGHKMFSSQFTAWHLTSTGITTSISTNIGSVHGWSSATALGPMKFNAQGTKVAVAVGNIDPGFVDVFDFNNATGILSNDCRIVIDSAIGGRVAGAEFSPDGSKLYVSGAGGCCVRIYQYDILAGNGTCADIRNSKALVVQSSQSGVINSLQIGPDNKIYCGYLSYYTLGCINFPNLSAATCGFVPSVLTFTNYHSGLPTYLAGYKYLNNLVNCNYEYTNLNTRSPDKNGIKIAPNPSTGEFILQSSEMIEEIRIYNQLAELVYLKSFQREKISFRIERPGIYFVYLKSADLNQIQKIVVQP